MIERRLVSFRLSTDRVIAIRTPAEVVDRRIFWAQVSSPANEPVIEGSLTTAAMENPTQVDPLIADFGRLLEPLPPPGMRANRVDVEDAYITVLVSH